LPALPTPIAAAPASSPEPADPLAERRVALRLLAERVAVCERCPALASSRTQTVFGVGRLDPDVCLVGEAPGADEDAQGEPFVGAAGQLLTRILAACGLRREDVYIANILKCRPPGNRTPEAQEADNCREHLLAQLDLVRPRFLLALGGTAIKGLLNTSASISRLRGKVHSFEGIPVVVTYHPAFLLPHRCPDDKTLRERKKMVWDDMKFLMTQLGRPVR
jgi:DNA polymerase